MDGNQMTISLEMNMRHRLKKAQASIEMLLALVVVVMMVFSVLKVAAWTGLEMVKVQKDHENKLSTGGNLSAPGAAGAMGQIDPYFHAPRKIKAAWLDL